MTDEQIEKWLAKHQYKPASVTSVFLADIMAYKSRHIKAHIPAWIFEMVSVVLVKCE